MWLVELVWCLAVVGADASCREQLLGVVVVVVVSVDCKARCLYLG